MCSTVAKDTALTEIKPVLERLLFSDIPEMNAIKWPPTKMVKSTLAEAVFFGSLCIFTVKLHQIRLAAFG